MEEEEIIPNFFCEANITLIPKPKIFQEKQSIDEYPLGIQMEKNLQ